MSRLDICLLKMVLATLIRGTRASESTIQDQLRQAMYSAAEAVAGAQCETESQTQSRQSPVHEGMGGGFAKFRGNLPDPHEWVGRPPYEDIPDKVRARYPMLPHWLADLEVACDRRHEPKATIKRYVDAYNSFLSSVDLRQCPHVARNPGLITFSESFFQGSASLGEGNTFVISSARATELGSEFSDVVPHMLIAINTTNIAPYQMQDDAKEMRRQFITFIRNGRSDVHSASYRQILASLQSEQNPDYTMRNMTDVWYQGNVAARYLKSTYMQESDQLLENKHALYQFGDFSTTVLDEFRSKFADAVQLFICKDLSYHIGQIVLPTPSAAEARQITQSGAAIRLVQSNSIIDNSIVQGITEVQWKPGNMGDVDSIVATATEAMKEYHEKGGYSPPYMVHNDTGQAYSRYFQWDSNSHPGLFSTMYALDKSNMYKPSQATCTIVYTLGTDHYRIDVHEIPPPEDGLP
ncbi:MAG: hypothetical protein LBF65_01965 [Holosporales bacterium]|nr:hypothetical protein [Holosporales bacterium]